MTKRIPDHLLSFEDVQEMIDYGYYDELGDALVELELKKEEEPSNAEYDRICASLSGKVVTYNIKDIKSK